jgi:hypothetical protein
MKTPEERIAELERSMFVLLSAFEVVATQIQIVFKRLLALEDILEVKDEAEIQAKMQAIEDAATLEAEYDPKYEEYRRLREFLRRQGEGQGTESPPDTH